jgi:hypothetical protein
MTGEHNSGVKHAVRIFSGILVLMMIAWFSAIGGMLADTFGYRWTVGAVGIWVLLPVGYVVGMALEKTVSDL